MGGREFVSDLQKPLHHLPVHKGPHPSWKKPWALFLLQGPVPWDLLCPTSSHLTSSGCGSAISLQKVFKTTTHLLYENALQKDEVA